MRASLLFLTSAITSFATATSYANITAATFYTTIPACVQSCTKLALSEDGCDVNDFACHCANPEKIGIHIAPCLETQTNCTTSDLMAFSQAVNSVCTFEASINSTVTWTNQTGSGPPGGEGGHGGPSGGHGGPPSNSSGGYGGYSGGGYGGSPTGPSVAVYTGGASSLKSAGTGLAMVAAVAMFAL